MSLDLRLGFPQINLSEVKRISNQVYEFGDFFLDAEHLMLYRAGEQVSLTPKQVETLLALVEKSGEIVSKEVLMTRVWGDTAVEEANLIQNVHFVRKVLGQMPNGQPVIETLRRRGYRFNGEIKKLPQSSVTKSRDDGGILAFVRQRKTLTALGIVVLALMFLSAFYPLPSEHPKRHFAVLPLQPIDSTHRNDLFEFGIADALANRLSTIGGFAARPLASIRKYSDDAQDPLDAGREQKVDYVLASNYQMSDGKIRITSQLFNVATGQVEDTYKFEREVSSVFALQDAVAADFAGRLMARFGSVAVANERARGTDNEEAYRLYLLGVQLYDQRGSNLRRSLEHLTEAVRLDPNYAQAWAMKAHALRAQINSDADRREALQAVQNALALNPNLAEAHSALCGNDFMESLPGNGEQWCTNAIDLDPTSSLAHRNYSGYLSSDGRHDEAIAEIKKAIDLDPTSYFNQRYYANVLYFARRYEDAVPQYKRLLELNPNADPTYQWLIRTLEALGRNDEAFDYLVRSLTVAQKDAETVERYKVTYRTAGWAGVLRERIRTAGEGQNNEFRQAGWCAAIGEKDRAFELLEKALADGDRQMSMAKLEPQMDPLRDDPRFIDLLRRIDAK